MRAAPLRVLAPLIATALLPGTAAAATVATVNNDPLPWHVIYTSAPGESDDVTVTKAGEWRFATGYPPPLYPGSLCKSLQQLLVISCPTFRTGLLRFNLGDGDDRVVLNYASEGEGIAFDGGVGNDRLDHSVNARTGAITAAGGPGSDTLNGGPGVDTLDGGEGDDMFGLVSGADVVLGGLGIDHVAFTGMAKAVTVTLDGQANDGVVSQRAQIDAEHVTGGDGDDQISGDGAPNRLIGGPGNDTLQGNSGVDVLMGDAGDDRLDARDGAADAVDCGIGNDTAIVDVADTVASCETVLLPDVDGDGVPVTLDCNDGNAAVRQGATDVPGNGIDEDCSGADAVVTVAPGPGGTTVLPTVTTVRSPISFGWDVKKRYTLLTRVVVRALPPGARITLTCTGKGCPKKATIRPTVSTADLTKRFARRQLAPGAKVELRVLADNAIGKVVTVTIRKNKDPSLKTTCLSPGATRPQRCV